MHKSTFARILILLFLSILTPPATSLAQDSAQSALDALDSALESLSKDKTAKPWLGVQIQDFDKKTAKSMGIDAAKGSLVTSVVPGSPADKAGIKTGDVILEFNGEAVIDALDFANKVKAILPGAKIDLTLLRPAKPFTASVVLGQRE
jgi:serine protease Do